MKAVIITILAAVMTAVVSVGAYAAGDVINQDSQEQNGSLNVDYNMDVTYTVAIPASVTFTDAEKTVERGLQVSDVVLSEGQALHVSVSSQNGFQMKNGDGYIDYYIVVNYATPLEQNNSIVLTINAGDGSGWVIFTFITELQKDYAQFAGRYSDTLTFTVSVV